MQPPAVIARTAVRLASACMASALLLACSTTRPSINEPARNLAGEPQQAAPLRERPIVAAVAFWAAVPGPPRSAWVCWRSSKATRFEIDGSEDNLARRGRPGWSGVSGGSILAGYYAAFGDEVFTRFKDDFLLANFQNALFSAPGRCPLPR